MGSAGVKETPVNPAGTMKIAAISFLFS